DIRELHVTGVQTCALPVTPGPSGGSERSSSIGATTSEATCHACCSRCQASATARSDVPAETPARSSRASRSAGSPVIAWASRQSREEVRGGEWHAVLWLL